MEPLCDATSLLVDVWETLLSSGGTVVMANPDARPATILGSSQHQGSRMSRVFHLPSGENDEPMRRRKHHHAADNVQKTRHLDAPCSLHSLRHLRAQKRPSQPTERKDGRRRRIPSRVDVETWR
jgi:hypothetical protein